MCPYFSANYYSVCPNLNMFLYEELMKGNFFTSYKYVMFILYLIAW